MYYTGLGWTSSSLCWYVLNWKFLKLSAARVPAQKRKFFFCEVHFGQRVINSASIIQKYNFLFPHVACPVDTYKIDASNNCIPCSMNTYTDGKQAALLEDCVCKPGFMSILGPHECRGT